MSKGATDQADRDMTDRTDPNAAGEEWASHDDRAIGRAVRWSGAAVLVLAGSITVVLLWLRRTPALPPPRVTQLVPPVAPTRPDAQIPAATFTDITKAAGIRFVHNNGAAGGKLLPETMGGGVAFFDYDNDGAQDLLFVNGTNWPGQSTTAAKSFAAALYHNDGHGEFADVTAGSGLDIVGFYGMGVAVGDFDNDSFVDVFLTGVGGYKLFRNQGDGSFADVTAQGGVSGAPQDWGTAAAFVDHDRDGDLDLFVCNYIRWSPEIDREVGYSLVGIGRAYGPPTNFQGAFSRLYRNDGDGTFTDVSESSGVQIRNTSATGVPVGKSLGVAPVDIDSDGWIDLIVANDTVQNFVLHNQRDGTFKEIGAQSGIAFDSYGNTRGAMGIDAARYRNDDSLGVGIGNFANEMVALYVSRGDAMLFSDEAIPEGVGPASRLLLKFGLFFFDYDLDSWQDLLTVNGHLEDEINKVQQSQQYKQPAQLFWNGGGIDAGFIAVPAQKCGSDIYQPIVGRGSAFADIDGDGDLDVVMTQIAGPPLLLRNDQKLGHSWLRLKLIGAKGNRDAIGATIRVRLGDKTLWRQVMPTRSYLSQSELPVTIGIGGASPPDSVTITWPDGTVQELDDALVNSVTVVQQPQ